MTIIDDPNGSIDDQKSSLSEKEVIQEDEKILIFGLNPKDPNDWITVLLTGVITVKGVQIVGQIIQAVMSKSSN